MLQRATATLILGARAQYETIIDAEDYPFLSRWRWNFLRSHNSIYARRATSIDGVKITLLLHHVILVEIMGLERPGDNYDGDHKNCNPLDNRKVNLRWLTIKKNRGNASASYAAARARLRVPEVSA